MKKLNTKGFTLAELLIVVAIIAVLVAISIPVFNSQLEKSREQTDIANIRAAKAAAIVGTMDWKIDLNGTLTSIDSTKSYYYDAAKGTFVSGAANKPSVGYGKGTGANGGCQAVDMGTTASTASYTNATVAQNKVLKCTFKAAKAAGTSAGGGATAATAATYALEWT